ncbi:NADH-quinone oxidoreductase subunit C [Streptomyces sp. NPDC001480]|uniref:NADH-quinone oxidoreductase subunit C n=1 Tax=Streptomyces sp. NPDC001480 TaxID=3364577 RepID=UPI003674B818
MTTVGWLPAPVEDLFGTEATAEESYEVLTVDVPPSSWIPALETARTTLSCTYFDWLSAVDEPGTGFRVSAHVVALSPVRRLLLRTTVPHEAPALASAVGVYAGAAWHERETHEMFGVHFEGHPALDHLLLPETFEGHPLRKDFVLAARVAKAWPGAKEPGESEHGGPKRRQMLPPGVPDPNEWGPLKGQLPPAPARPARGEGRAAATGERPARAAGERPVRRTRTAAEGSASQAPETGAAAAGAGAAGAAAAGASAEAAPAEAPPTAPRRARSASGGAASQRDTAGPAAPRRARSASGGSASQRVQGAEGAEPTEPTATPPDTPARPAPRSTAPQSSDAPWHHARPAFDEGETERAPQAEPEPQAERGPEPVSEPQAERGPEAGRDSEPQAEREPEPGCEPAPGEETPTRNDPTGGPQ